MTETANGNALLAALNLKRSTRVDMVVPLKLAGSVKTLVPTFSHGNSGRGAVIGTLTTASDGSLFQYPRYVHNGEDAASADALTASSISIGSASTSVSATGVRRPGRASMFSHLFVDAPLELEKTIRELETRTKPARTFYLYTDEATRQVRAMNRVGCIRVVRHMPPATSTRG